MSERPKGREAQAGNQKRDDTLSTARLVSLPSLDDVTAVRELSDGRVVAIERGARRVVVLSPCSRELRVLGRPGEGPGEYRYPRALVGIGADSSIVTDAQLARWLVLRGDKIVGTLTSEHPQVAGLHADLVGSDTSGHIVATVSFSSSASRCRGLPPSYRGFSDSALVLRAKLLSSRVDMVGPLRFGATSARWLSVAASPTS